MMKKILMFALFTVAIAVPLAAQNPQIYEVKKVIIADSVKASTLYVRSLEALSNWTGSQQKSKANIDVQDKDEGIVVYKGMLYLGYGKQNMMYGWDTFADFTMKVRCKDGKAQVTFTIPTLTYFWTADNSSVTVPVSEVFPEYRYSGKMLIKKASLKLAPTIPDTVDAVVNAIAKDIKSGSGDDF